MKDYLRKEIAGRKARITAIDDEIGRLGLERQDIYPAIKILDDMLKFLDDEEKKHTAKGEVAPKKPVQTAKPEAASPAPVDEETTREGETAEKRPKAELMAVSPGVASPKKETVDALAKTILAASNGGPPPVAVHIARPKPETAGPPLPPKPEAGGGVLRDGRRTPPTNWETAAERHTEAARALPASKVSKTETAPSWRDKSITQSKPEHAIHSNGKISIVGNYLEAGGKTIRLKSKDEIAFAVKLHANQHRAVTKPEMATSVLYPDQICMEVERKLKERKVPLRISSTPEGYKFEWL